MELSSNEVRTLFGVPPISKSDKIEQVVLTYLYLAYARFILERELIRFDQQSIDGIKYPRIYAKGVHDALSRLSVDMHAIKKRLNHENIRINPKPEPTSIPDIQHRYWHNGRTATVGATPFLFSRRVAKTIQTYLFP